MSKDFRGATYCRSGRNYSACLSLMECSNVLGSNAVLVHIINANNKIVNFCVGLQRRTFGLLQESE